MSPKAQKSCEFPVLGRRGIPLKSFRAPSMFPAGGLDVCQSYPCRAVPFACPRSTNSIRSKTRHQRYGNMRTPIGFGSSRRTRMPPRAELRSGAERIPGTGLVAQVRVGFRFFLVVLHVNGSAEPIRTQTPLPSRGLRFQRQPQTVPSRVANVQ